jgi:hypothetical protein
MKLTEKDLELLKKRNPNFKDFTTKRDNEGVISSAAATKLKPKSTKKSKVNKYLELFKNAEKAGMEALKECVPTPMMVVEHESPFDDNSPVKNAWHVPQGACGFAWVNIKYRGEGAKLINAMKKAKLAGGINSWASLRKDDYYGGYTYWVSAGNQSIELKEAFAYAMVRVLEEAGVSCYASSRLD